MRHLLACAPHDYGCNAKYAASSWSGQGILLLGVIVLLFLGVLNQGTRKPAMGLLTVAVLVLGAFYFKNKTGA